MNVLGSFPAMNFGDTQGSVPPDTLAAAGPTEIVETVNNNIAIYNKNGTAVLNPTGLGTFFQSVGPIQQLSDSVVAYDEVHQKFFVGVLNISTNGFWVTSDSFLYAVSTTSSPKSASDFQFFSVNLTGQDPAGAGSYWADYPRLGWNADAYVASFNMFTTNSAQSYSHPLVLNISSSAPGTRTLVDAPGGVANFTLAPATMHGSAAGGPMYFVEEKLDSAGNATGNAIRVATESNLLGSPSFTFADVPLPAAAYYTSTPSATQKGSSNQIQANDSRILNAEWRGNHLVAAQAIGVATDTQAHARWYELDTTSTPNLLQSGTIGVGSGANSYFPAIAIAPNNVLGMTYMESSPTEYMSMYVTGRLSSDPLGQMETPPGLAQAGQATYHGFDTPPYRAGDYSGITVDPSDGTFWAANEYATSSTSQAANWGTALGHLQVTNPAAPPTITSTGANPNPVPGKTTTLSANATDPNSGATITGYTWSVQQGPSGVTFDANNGTSSGSTETATFAAAGNYTFLVKVTDSLGASSTATVGVTVNQTLTSITVAPATATVPDGGTQQFTATATDQFGTALTTQPAFTWGFVGTHIGTISTTGLYTAPASGTGTDTVQAASGTVNGTANATVTSNAPPTVSQPTANPSPVTGKTTTLSVTATAPNNDPMTYTWSVLSGPAVTFSANGTGTANSTTATFAAAGSYTFQVVVKDTTTSLTSSKTVAVAVNQTLSSITVSPPTATVANNGTQQFTATAKDQFGNALATQPGFTWTHTASAGTIDSTTGLYTAPASGTGPDTVQAASGTASGTASVTVTSNVLEFKSTDVPAPIWSGYAIVSNLTISQDVTIADIDVKLNITHPRDRDLYIYLVSPSGVSTVLSNFRGTGANFGTNSQSTTFDSEAKTSISGARSPFAGSYRPDGNLATYNRKNARGTWHLYVEDWGYSNGQINSWSLVIKTSSATPSGPALAIGAPSRSTGGGSASPTWAEVLGSHAGPLGGTRPTSFWLGKTRVTHHLPGASLVHFRKPFGV